MGFPQKTLYRDPKLLWANLQGAHFCGVSIVGTQKDKTEPWPPWTSLYMRPKRTTPLWHLCTINVSVPCAQPHSSPTVTLCGPTWACFLGTCSNKSQPVCVQTSVLSDHFVPHYSLSSSYFAVSLPHSRHEAHRDTLRKSSTVCRMKWTIDLLWPASASSIQQQVVASGQMPFHKLFLFITVRYNLWWRKNTAVYSRKSHGCITNNLPPTSN